MKYFINSNQYGLLFKKQSFVRVLKQGEYRVRRFSKSQIIVVDKKENLETVTGIDIKTINNKTSLFDTIHVNDYEVVFHYIDGIFYDILLSGSHSYIQDVFTHTFIKCDSRNIVVPEKIDVSILNTNHFKNRYSELIKQFYVQDGTVGVLTVNSKFEKILQPGRYYFFVNNNTVVVKPIDLRLKTANISGQELLTKDKITLRINFALNYKINDAVKVATEFEKYDEQLYLTMQLALREYISTKNLDELLAEKHEIGKIILETVKNKESDYGATFIEAGVKDIILPGEIKEILNTVLIAEKKALANVITRREETASTRSLLNTAKLLEENATLYKLKEMEYLERICDKIGNISLTSSGGILEQLSEIIKSK